MKQKLIIGLFFLSFIFLFAQNAETIIKRHFEVTGSESKWNKLNSITIDGEAILGLDQIFKLKIYHRRPYLKSVVFVIDGVEVLNEGYDGKNGWTFDANLQKNIIVPNYQPDSFENDLLNYEKKGFKAAFIKEEPFEDKTCLIVELTKNTNKVNYCFDKETYQLLWEKNKEETLYYSDFQKVEGLTFAKKIVGKPIQGGEYTIFFKNIQINKSIPEKKFKFKK